MITHTEMVRKLAKSGKDILASMTPQKLHVWHMASCLMGEAGEVLESDDADNLLEELSDLEFYMVGLRDCFNISFESIPKCEMEDHMVLYAPDGLMIATCDIFDCCKKWFIYEKELDIEKLLNAISYYEFYMNLLCEENDFTRGQVLAANMAKLAKRYGENYEYTNQKAQDRADKQT